VLSAAPGTRRLRWRQDGRSQRSTYRTLSDPVGNDSGRIVGVYLTGNGVQHGFEFTPAA
jgi:hypothetical protein